MKTLDIMQKVCFYVIVASFGFSYVAHFFMALGSHRWGLAIALAFVALFSYAVAREAWQEMKND